LSLGLAFFFYC